MPVKLISKVSRRRQRACDASSVMPEGDRAWHRNSLYCGSRNWGKHGIVCSWIQPHRNTYCLRDGLCLASFTTFVTIIGRYKYGSGSIIDGCCSVLEQDKNKRFLSNLAVTFMNFGSGLRKIKELSRQPNLRVILDNCRNCLHSYC